MKFLQLSILSSIFLVSCLGKNQMEAMVIRQADELARNLMRDELETYLDKMAHFVYANPAEREQLKQNLINQEKFSSNRGADMIKAVSQKNSEIFEHEGYFQCIIKQVRFFANNVTTYTDDFYLLAVSKDGETWKFADITNIPIKILRGVFKEMHPDLDVVKESKE